MTENEVLNRFPAHRLEGALRFSAHEVRVGTEAPDFALPDLSGKTVRLSSYRDKSNVVLMFGSVTCGATATQLRASKPSIRSLYARYKKKGFEFFLIYTKEPHPGENNFSTQDDRRASEERGAAETRGKGQFPHTRRHAGQRG